MADDAELIIAGGGLNGMLLAIACAGAGLSTVVIDRQDPAAMTTDRFDGRTSAIAYGSRLVFDGIGLWPAIEAAAEPIREIRVADDDSPLFLHYDHRELGGSAVDLFLPAAPFAILPMTDEPSEDAVYPRRRRSSIVWTEDADLAPHLLALPDAEFATELRTRFGDFLGAVEPVGPRWSYPLA